MKKNHLPSITRSSLLNANKVTYKGATCYACGLLLFYIIVEQKPLDNTSARCRKCKIVRHFLLFNGKAIPEEELPKRKKLLMQYNIKVKELGLNFLKQYDIV